MFLLWKYYQPSQAFGAKYKPSNQSESARNSSRHYLFEEKWGNETLNQPGIENNNGRHSCWAVYPTGMGE